MLGEFFVNVAPENHQKMYESFYQNFMVIPHDAASAETFARISYELVLSVRDSQTTRNHVKADYMIVGAAISHGASCSHSHDSNILNFAGKYIAAKKMAHDSEQLRML